ncbi:MAG: hypothetical protein JHC84_07125 [Solirubrobacteraceae bacterium]|nr:hypothetical protein [Solirubrobacteraceae bacterium]
MYDELSGDRAVLARLAEWRADLAVRQRRRAVCDEVCAGVFDVEEARAAADSGMEAADALGLLWGIDAALERINPYRASTPPVSLAGMVSWYQRESRFSSDAVDGALIPRSQDSGRPNQEPATFRDAFPGVLRVQGLAWDEAERVRLPLLSQLSLAEIPDGLLVGCAPVLNDPGELRWDVRDRNDVSYYEARVDDAVVRARQSEIMRGLDDAGVLLGIAPELSCSGGLVRDWRSTLDSSLSPDSGLRWIFAGSGDLDGAARPVNAGLLLDATNGETLLRQDKMYAFTLTGDQVESWKLPLPHVEALDEDIRRGERLHLVETGVGWLTVLICQDLAEQAEIDDLVIEHGVRWILAPVFSEPTEPHYWEHQMAKRYAVEAGSTTIVANSLVVARGRGEKGPAHTALVHGPGGHLGAKTSAPTDVAAFAITQASVSLYAP